MTDVVLDANVLVGYLDAQDTHHARARGLIERLEAHGHESVLLDVLVAESISVLCRRARERKSSPPDLDIVLERVREWSDAGEMRRHDPTFNRSSEGSSTSSRAPEAR